MPDIIDRIEPASIAAVIEANINAYLLSFARLPGATLHDDASTTWVDSGVASATLNSIVRAHFTPDAANAHVDSILAHFKQRNQPVTWHIGPTTTPPDLGQTLLAHGMTHSEDEPGMAVELAHIQDTIPPPERLTIQEVRDERGLRDWVSVWLFPTPDETRQRHFAALLHRGLGDDLPWRYYVGYLDGKPVATSELFVGEGVAAVHYVVTQRELRRRGIGAAMTLHVLRAARDQGYRVAVLTASPDGHGTYQRIGFQDYCWFHRYEWEPDNAQ
ncbi:MAG: GNAT family N-acetyltransferase [Ktedonobacterales bacterium]